MYFLSHVPSIKRQSHARNTVQLHSQEISTVFPRCLFVLQDHTEHPTRTQRTTRMCNLTEFWRSRSQLQEHIQLQTSKEFRSFVHSLQPVVVIRMNFQSTIHEPQGMETPGHLARTANPSNGL